jgi:hypothetical protein
MTERYRRRSRTITILDAIADPQLFGQHFRDHVTWAAWCVFLCALFGLPLTSEQLALYTKYTGRTTPPTTPLHEAWAGRRRRSRVEATRLRAAGQKLGIALGQSRGRSVHAAGSLCLDR